MVFPISTYMKEELKKSFKVFKFCHFEDQNGSIDTCCFSIRAVVTGSGKAGVAAGPIEFLPKLEIIPNFSVRLDKIAVKGKSYLVKTLIIYVLNTLFQIF